MSEEKFPQDFVLIKGNTELGYRRGRVVIRVPREIRLPKVGCVLLVGRNGRGKTTLLKYLAGCLPKRPVEMPRRVYLPEELDFAPNMSPALLGRCLLDRAARERFRAVGLQLDLVVNQPFGELSKGNRQKLRLALTMARAHQIGAGLVLLDEPMSGLDSFVRQRAGLVISEESRSRLVIASVHQLLPEVSVTCVLLVVDGEVRVIEGNNSSWRDCLVPSEIRPQLARLACR